MRNSLAHVLTLLLAANHALASSGEAETVYLGEGKYRATRPLWANAYAPNTPANNAGGVNDLNPGDVFEIGDLSDATTILINGFPSNIETYKANLQEGDRVLVRNERRWIQLLNHHTSNLFDEGVIQKVAPDAKSVTIKYYTNLPSGRVTFESRTLAITARMIIRLEGKDATAADALKPGRHLRFYQPRPQTVLASDEAGRKDTRSHRGGSQGWTRQGFFRGVSQRATLFAEYRNGQWIDSFALDRIDDIDGYNLGPGGKAAYARPGDRLITGSRLVGDTSTFNTTYGSYIPSDDRSVIGEITAVNGERITLKVAVCPTGLAKEGRFEQRQIDIAPSAGYHLNGRRGSTRDEALKVGHHVRVLAALPAGAALVRETEPDHMAIADTPVHPIFPTGRSTTLRFLNEDWEQADQVSVLENETARLRVFLYTHGPTRYEWRRNGVTIPGSQGAVDGYKVLRFDEYADLTDDGASFTCLATTEAGQVESQPIVLSVAADRRPLGLAGAFVAGKNAILLTYNKKVDARTAQDPANYTCKAKIRRATLIGNGQTVVLETADLTPDARYDVVVKNVVDISAEPNRIAGGAKMSVAYRVAFRYFRFTLTEKKNLNARINELRLRVGDQLFGRDAKASGTSKSRDNLFDGDRRTNGQFDRGQQVTFDLGPGSAIAPDAIEFEVTTTTRPVMGYRLEGSDDGETWTRLAEHAGEKLTQQIKHPIDLAALDAKAILKAKRVQSIDFPAPTPSGSTVELAAKASSGLPVNYHVIEGPGQVVQDRLTIKAAGKIRVRAMQPGNGEFYSAYPVERVIDAPKSP